MNRQTLLRKLDTMFSVNKVYKVGNTLKGKNFTILIPSENSKILGSSQNTFDFR